MASMHSTLVILLLLNLTVFGQSPETPDTSQLKIDTSKNSRYSSFAVPRQFFLPPAKWHQRSITWLLSSGLNLPSLEINTSDNLSSSSYILHRQFLLPPVNQPGSAYGNSGNDILGSTAYQISYLQHLQREDIPKREISSTEVVVPVLSLAYLAAYGGYKGYMALRGDPPLDFDQTDLRLLELIWEHPGRKPLDYYAAYNELDGVAEQTYLILKQRIDKLKGQRILESRQDIDNNEFFSPKLNRNALRVRLLSELRETQYSQLSRKMELKDMLKWLETKHAATK